MCIGISCLSTFTLGFQITFVIAPDVGINKPPSKLVARFIIEKLSRHCVY